MIQEFSPSGPDPDSESLERMVAIRRNRLSKAIDDIGEELSPARVLERGIDEGADAAIRELKDKTSLIVEAASDTIKKHPLPLLVMGAGLLFWLSSKRND